MLATSTSTDHWRSLFESWPEAIDKRGAIVTHQGESVPFVNFMISHGLLLIERDGPDVAGTRKIIVGYDSIAMVKLSATGELSRLQSMGFQPAL